jgi:trimethylamine:corrinoid methyltransferase-like protein
MFRIGGVLMMISYLSVILVRPFAQSGANSAVVMSGKFVVFSARVSLVTYRLF